GDRLHHRIERIDQWSEWSFWTGLRLLGPLRHDLRWIHVEQTAVQPSPGYRSREIILPLRYPPAGQCRVELPAFNGLVEDDVAVADPEGFGLPIHQRLDPSMVYRF